jgi:transposase
MAHRQDRPRVVVGVDTHQDRHVAVAVDQLGVRVGSISVAATSAGYRELAGWAADLGQVLAFGVEGTGSYGAGLTRDLQARRSPGHRSQPAGPVHPAAGR